MNRSFSRQTEPGIKLERNAFDGNAEGGRNNDATSREKLFPLILQWFVLVEGERMNYLLQGLACSEQKISCSFVKRQGIPREQWGSTFKNPSRRFLRLLNWIGNKIQFSVTGGMEIY